MSNNILNEQFNVLTNEEITESNDIQKALELINKENVVAEIDIKPVKKFIVEKNDKLKEIIESTLPEEQSDAELDEIANQADQAFYDLMDMVVGVSVPHKGTAEMAGAAHAFLDIKLKSKIAKTELKLKKMKQELDEKKLKSATTKENNSDDDYTSDSEIIVIDRTNQ
jgi:hypothetical protein